MTLTWPLEKTPKILTLVGNDLTIDTRARKTASSLARAGFSVISIGIDKTGLVAKTEYLDGALLHRVTPPTRSSISSQTFRFSLPQLRDSFYHRSEEHRSLLQFLRRNLTSAKTLRASKTFFCTDLLCRLIAKACHVLHVSHDLRQKIIKQVGIRFSRFEGKVVFFPLTFRALLIQRRFQATAFIYRGLVRLSQNRQPKLKKSWRSNLPELERYEAALGGIVDGLEADLIHVHDIFHLGLAVRSKKRAEARGRTLIVVYDVHEHIPGLPISLRQRAAYQNLEEEYAPQADALVTVSPGLVGFITKRFGVSAELILNAPDLETATATKPLRDIIGLSADTPLIIYVGGIAPHRGAEDLVKMIPLLSPHAHLAFIAASPTGYVATLSVLAESLGIGARVHIVPYVAPESVVSYISSADVSVIPLSREVPNYEIALPNKLFQSIHAQVPVVVSDNPDMSRFVSEHKIGEIFLGGDVNSMAAAVAKILNDPLPYAEALKVQSLLHKTTWSDQSKKLQKVYQGLGVNL
jgi:glycosyltransferase involved in cell wall biosynthesis